MANPSLGDYEFVVFHRSDAPAGGPLVIREQLMPITRLGVDGVALLRTGQRSDPFQMRSGVDCLNTIRLAQQMALYLAMIGEKGYELVWQNVNYSSAYNTDYVVMDVTQSASRYMPVQSGGLNSGSTCWLECIWTLQPVFADQSSKVKPRRGTRT